MEEGTARIGAAELVVLLEFLEIPAHRVWSGGEEPAGGRQVVVQAAPGETVRITVVQG